MKILTLPVTWGVLASIAIVGLAFLLGAAEITIGGLSQSRFSAFWASPPNEIGDTLAGFAGALAFVWIIVTVAMQSIELGEQRKVLALQKDEMELQRKATEDMARAMASQADILEDEKRHRVEGRAAELLERLLEKLKLDLVEANETIFWSYKVKDSSIFSENGAIEKTQRLYGIREQQDAQSAFRGLHRQVSENCMIVGQLGDTNFFSRPRRSYLSNVLQDLEQILKLKTKLAPDQWIRVQVLELPELRGVIRAASVMDIWEGSL